MANARLKGLWQDMPLFINELTALSWQQRNRAVWRCRRRSGARHRGNHCSRPSCALTSYEWALSVWFGRYDSFAERPSIQPLTVAAVSPAAIRFAATKVTINGGNAISTAEATLHCGPHRCGQVAHCLRRWTVALLVCWPLGYTSTVAV